ncbi:ubiquitin-like domain-containing protein [Salipaludibacillus sp. LMS25]|jgi:uncharacterized protein YabE (DUF348 family)|uniref:G5 and 3D domain-containing protein n=1 Tax=Salipaludibacillus sp. LMS25 TaxID=2924031 RepID=UPI0020D1314E|nr:G5 and 3D domain-containing protein [Salipaludibacillus sp. LMS25]UTR16643.1 ubiquitin-like domain-containing protein [Salipaludibacillus sp. LMS25]
MIQWTKQLPVRFAWRKIAVSSVGVLTLMTVLVLAIYELTKTEVTVEANGELLSVYTHASTVGEVLDEQNIEVGEHDLIEPTTNTAIDDAMTITYKHAQEVYVHLDEEEETVFTTSDTVGELMDELDIEVEEYDDVTPPVEEPVIEGLTIHYESAFQVTVFSDGEEETLWTTSTTVADFLEQESITLEELDRVEPSGDETLVEETELHVIRVEKVTDVVEEAVDFATVTEKDSSLEEGSEKVKQQGQEGKIEKHYEVIFENGEEVSRELVKENIVEESEDQIVAVGTQKSTETVSRGSNSSSDSGSSSASSDSSSSNEWQTFTATAYTANCNGCSGVTSTGIDLNANPNANVIAVDPNVIPLGSRVEVKGHGTYIAGDTGGAIQGNKIDIFIPNRDQVRAFGRRTVELRVLD